MGTLSYILLYYRHNIKIVKTNKTRCQRDQDSPNLYNSLPSWPTSWGPRRERSCPDLRLSRDFGLTSRPTSSRTPRTSSTSFQTPRCSPSSERRRSCLRDGQVPQDSPDKCLNHLKVKVSIEEEYLDDNQKFSLNENDSSHPRFLCGHF